MKTERVVLNLQARDSLLLVRESKVQEEVAGYDSRTTIGAHKIRCAQEWFNENAVDVPVDMTQRIDRALAELADAQAALFQHIEGCDQDPELTRRVIQHLRRGDGE